MVDFNDAFKKLKKNNIQPVYILYGESQYFIDLFKQKVMDLLKDEVQEEINYYDLRETAIQDVLVDVETIPFFTDRKLIIAENMSFITSKQEKIQVEHDVTALEAYVQHPASYSVLICIVPFDKLDERKKITKLLKKHVEVVHCAPLKEKALRNWVLYLAKEEQITVDADACDLLEAEFETNLTLLASEMKKLALYVGEGGHVTNEIVRNLMSTSLNQTALQLVDAVLKNDLYAAIHIYKGLEKMREDEIGLLALLSYQFRIIFQVKLLVNKGYPLQRIQSEVKVHPYVVKLARERSNRYSITTLQKIMNELTNTDQKIKTGVMDKAIAFEMLLYQLSTLKQYS